MVPTIAPACVISDVSPARAMPKSATLATPSGSMITFWGLMSRWTIPRLCA